MGVSKLEMSVRERLGYNWKARQQKRSHNGKLEGGAREKRINFQVELEESIFGSVCESSQQDTNVQVLPPKKEKLSEKGGFCTSKKRRLNPKQRKRLLKVVEAKEKKAKVLSN